MKKKLIILTAIATLSLSMAACGSDNTSSEEGMGGNNEVNSSTNIETDSNENISANVPIEQETIDPRIGKTLGELMDLSAYLEECNTLDVYKDSARELSNVLPFEIYEFYNGELVNYYADGSGTKTVKAASIEGTYGSVMVIKMDDSETFDIVMRATSDRYEAYDSCTYSSLVDFKVIQTNLTKEEVENMLYDNGILKEEYRHLLQGSAEVTTTGQTLNDYILTQGNQPKYYVLNPYENYYEDLTEFTMEYLLETKIVLVYLGEDPMPIPGDEVAVVPTYFEAETLSYKSLEEVIETINNYNISEIIPMPDDAGLKSLANKYSGKIAKTSTFFEVGKTLDSQIDLTAYNEIVEELEVNNDYTRELKDILPFEIYSIDYNYGLCNVNDYEGTTHSVLASSIPGEMHSVMIIRMDNATTYDILLRVPYESNDYYNSCFFKDLGNYIVIANDLTKQEVERMVIPGDYLEDSYMHLIFDNANEENDYR